MDPSIQASRALVIGINRYSKVAPLSYAVQDAQAVADALIKDFAFPTTNVQILLDQSATRNGIMRAFLAYEECASDDRLLVFFAGHGHTRPARRQEVGFLVPVDGDINDLSTLIRWDDLTRNSELIPAKHVFFIMDACYGGLAFVRGLPPGSLRFLQDMVQRYPVKSSRQARPMKLSLTPVGPCLVTQYSPDIFFRL